MITVVQFHDPHVASGTWVYKSDDPFSPPAPCEAVGRVLFEDKEWITLSSLHSSEMVNTTFTLYKRSIISRRDYEVS